ncbi:hypothetical protein KJ763_02200 [Patescibacteria group bacterium]|nr:hypothetical protein [Patescibacteria group bacterium]
MRLVMVARDMAPSMALKKIQKRYESEISITSFLGFGKSINESMKEIERNIKTADIVLLGMSSSEELTREEILAGLIAFDVKKPFGFFADTYNVIGRPWFSALKNIARFLFVINKDEEKKAKLNFPNSEIIISGNPIWEDFFFPQISYRDIRRQIGVNDDEKIILCPGGKNFIVNVLHWGGVIDAVNLFNFGSNSEKFKIILAMHPGDLNDPNFYVDLVKFSKVPVMITKNSPSSSQIVSGCNIVVQSASTIGIEAACQRKPVIDYFTSVAMERLKESTGCYSWEPCELGISKAVISGSEALRNNILNLLGKGYSSMREIQERIFPMPKEKGKSLEIIISSLKKFLPL